MLAKRNKRYIISQSKEYRVTEVIKIMFGKRLSTIICAALLAITCIGSAACKNNRGGEETRKPLHDSAKWFTEEELSAKGLAGLPAPSGLSGKINSSDA